MANVCFRFLFYCVFYTVNASIERPQIIRSITMLKQYAPPMPYPRRNMTHYSTKQLLKWYERLVLLELLALHDKKHDVRKRRVAWTPYAEMQVMRYAIGGLLRKRGVELSTLEKIIRQTGDDVNS